MRLKFEQFDGRRRQSKPVIDQDTGERIGTIKSLGVGFSGYGDGGYGGIEISLFDGAYTAKVTRYDECVGFVKGIEAVLNRMMPPKPNSVLSQF